MEVRKQGTPGDQTPLANLSKEVQSRSGGQQSILYHQVIPARFLGNTERKASVSFLFPKIEAQLGSRATEIQRPAQHSS